MWNPLSTRTPRQNPVRFVVARTSSFRFIPGVVISLWTGFDVTHRRTFFKKNIAITSKNENGLNLTRSRWAAEKKSKIKNFTASLCFERGQIKCTIMFSIQASRVKNAMMFLIFGIEFNPFPVPCPSKNRVCFWFMIAPRVSASRLWLPLPDVKQNDCLTGNTTDHPDRSWCTKTASNGRENRKEYWKRKQKQTTYGTLFQSYKQTSKISWIHKRYM